MKTENLCDNCSDKIRGLCCYYNIELEGYNVILLNQHCEYLDTETMLCKDYEHRNEVNPYCLTGKMFNTGCLPKGCVYLEGHPEREENPKIDIRKVIDKLSPQSVSEYNFWNNVEDIERFAIKNED